MWFCKVFFERGLLFNAVKLRIYLFVLPHLNPLQSRGKDLNLMALICYLVKHSCINAL